jgi:hypothetical protein
MRIFLDNLVYAFLDPHLELEVEGPAPFVDQSGGAPINGDRAIRFCSIQVRYSAMHWLMV